MPSACFDAILNVSTPWKDMPKACPYVMALSFLVV